MTRIRAAALATLVIFLTGCSSVVFVPSGIVDNFVPPQGRPATVQLDRMTCDEAVRSDPAAVETKDIVPCALDILTLGAPRPTRAVPRSDNPQRPRPPRMGR